MRNARYTSYIICTSPRSGSTLLCRMLAATGRSGQPDSHFHKPSLSSWLKTFALSAADFASDRDALKAIFEVARKRGTGDTGIFGLRLQRGSFDYFMQQAGLLYPDQKSDLDRIQAAFGSTLFIHLTRENKLDQAISIVKATQTGLWHRAADGTELERLSAPQDPVYDADEIAGQLAGLSALDTAWKTWFEREKLHPLRISYEALSDDPAGMLAKILEALGLDQDMAQDIEPPVAKLADATNRIWAERFRAEKRHGQYM
ncbi:sulfotransferase [Rhodophyticola sp. CCM32]|uniref:Stf0 family sulfotransferase n=1 Tax=Rhodophyticola sp. CCM32 TaxID=2916397 RepID=UPI00107FB223|nr:Stf0 family sulfotransferase [Rhodophyticola sp. CCM32]QBX99566.1 sulfotransferase [Rhodophyticola sp. CCM32]